MNGTTTSSDTAQAPAAPTMRGRLFRKYVALFMLVVSVAIVANGLLEIWFTSREQTDLLSRIQRGQAEAAALQIGQFITEIEGQMAWATQLPWSPDTLDEWRFDAVRLLRQVPAVTEVAQLDPSGHEQARMSRQTMDVVGSRADFSQSPIFIEAVAKGVYYGPIFFLRESEPYMTLALAGSRREYGVVVALINLKFIWDVVSQIRVGNTGAAYVIDAQGRLIAHPDISLVLRNIDFSRLAHVQTLLRREDGDAAEPPTVVENIDRHQVLSAYAPVPHLGWTVFAELPIAEAFAPVYASIARSAAFLVGALVLALFGGLFLARRVAGPIEVLRDGAARIGSGDLSHRFSIKSGDELETLGNQFNSMAAQLEESYATLERKVEERTHQLELANLAKSRFLAAASHDLRQPLHALGLFVAQLHGYTDANERARVVERIEAALGAMNELFSALLDISKLDSGVMTANKTDFPITRLLERVESTFAADAQGKGLRLRVVDNGTWVQSDFILLERIVFNLVSNAVRYTARGGIVVGCRRRGKALRIEVCDTGPGIPAAERRKIFGEFYRLGADRGQRGGLGLGLAIVDRLCQLLGQPVELTSVVGRGSRFAVVVPLAVMRDQQTPEPAAARAPVDVARGKLIVVVDDDPLVRDGMEGVFQSWGCRVVTGNSDGTALSNLSTYDCAPDLIISDYRLQDGTTGIDVIENLRRNFAFDIPAFLISGDTNPEPLQEARANGYHLLHKPVDPMTLRAMINRILKRSPAAPVP
jgi:signal transduction histidine kinase